MQNKIVRVIDDDLYLHTRTHTYPHSLTSGQFIHIPIVPGFPNVMWPRFGLANGSRVSVNCKTNDKKPENQEFSSTIVVYSSSLTRDYLEFIWELNEREMASSSSFHRVNLAFMHIRRYFLDWRDHNSAHNELNSSKSSVWLWRLTAKFELALFASFIHKIYMEL